MNYIGSKYSLLDFIDYGITGVSGYKAGTGCIFADLFAGTGVVGSSYKAKGCEVISNAPARDVIILQMKMEKNVMPSEPIWKKYML